MQWGGGGAHQRSRHDGEQTTKHSFSTLSSGTLSQMPNPNVFTGTLPVGPACSLGIDWLGRDKMRQARYKCIACKAGLHPFSHSVELNSVMIKANSKVPYAAQMISVAIEILEQVQTGKKKASTMTTTTMVLWIWRSSSQRKRRVAM